MKIKSKLFIATLLISTVTLFFAAYIVQLFIDIDDNVIFTLVLLQSLLFAEEVDAQQKKRKFLWGYVHGSKMNKLLFALLLFFWYLWTILGGYYIVSKFPSFLIWIWGLIGLGIATCIFFMLHNKKETENSF